MDKYVGVTLMLYNKDVHENFVQIVKQVTSNAS